MKGLDFTLAKGTRRSTLFKLSKEAKKKMMKEPSYQKLHYRLSNNTI